MTMTVADITNETVSESEDFNVYVGAITGLLKGISLNPKANLCKNLSSNFDNLDRSQHEITCMTWIPETQEDQILVGLRNGTFRAYSVSDKKFCGVLKCRTDEHLIDLMIGIASCGDSVITAAESGK